MKKVDTILLMVKPRDDNKHWLNELSRRFTTRIASTPEGLKHLLQKEHQPAYIVLDARLNGDIANTLEAVRLIEESSFGGQLIISDPSDIPEEQKQMLEEHGCKLICDEADVLDGVLGLEKYLDAA